MIQILIVEDDYRLADIHQRFLTDLDYVNFVGKALTGKDALELVENNKVDLVLLDLYLPDMLGVEIINKMRIKQPNIDFIVISAASESDIVGKVIRSGVFDYIIKPVIKERLVETVLRYRDLQSKFINKSNIEQQVLDNYFGVASEKADKVLKPTPKGIDPLTLEKVNEMMQEIHEGVTAEQLGEKIGASRTTARRYLEFLIAQGEIIADLEYGTIGRPERIYVKNNRK
ncbi:response regulator [Oceanobacillus sp. CAU 1775]